MKKKKLFIYIFVILLMVFIDQLTKYLVINNFELHEEKPVIGNLLVLTYIRNSGAAWGSFAGKATLLLVFTFIVFIFIFRILHRIWDIPKFKPIRICLLFVIGGAIGNMIDRIRFNYVIDFIFFKFIKFPVFNIADIFVTLSVIVLVILFIFKYNDADHDILLGIKPKDDNNKTTKDEAIREKTNDKKRGRKKDVEDN